QTSAATQDEKSKALKREATTIQNRIATCEQEIERIYKAVEGDQNPYTKQIQTLHEKTNPYIDQQLQAEQKLKEVNKQRKELIRQKELVQQDHTDLLTKIVAVEYWKHGFKRIRLYFVQKILAALEIEIQSVMNSLGLDDWSIKLNTETETRSTGNIKLGISLVVISPSATGSFDTLS